MTVDKNLFLYNLAIVATVKDDANHLKEWLDYHLLAGVEHFYLYDHDSTDNYNEIIKPYVEAGFVTSTTYSSKVLMFHAYNEAVKKFKFKCRYMAFIDVDEFIYPKSAPTIIEIVDEILSRNPNAAGLVVNRHVYGSDEQQTADYSRGVLDRYTVRNSGGRENFHVKTIANPRAINFLNNPHSLNYFEGVYAVNEKGGNVQGQLNNPVTADKIIINYYDYKSRDGSELIRTDKISRAGESNFALHYRNDDSDEGILHYRAARAKTFKLPDQTYAAERLFNALSKNLSPTLLSSTPSKFYAGKMETFLTCRDVAAYLKKQLVDDAPAKFFEEASLKAMLKSFTSTMNLTDARLFIRELPDLFALPYPVVKDLHSTSIKVISQMTDTFRLNGLWKDCVEMDYLQRLLKNI